MPFVIDASVAASWCFPDENEAWADATGRRWNVIWRLVAKRPQAT